MSEIRFNTAYLQQNRGVIKIFQVVIGFIISGLYCGGWSKAGCYGYGQLGYTTTVNSVVTIINIVFFVLNLLNLKFWKLERIYGIICAVLFLVASALMIWFLVVETSNYSTTQIIGTILVVTQFLLFVWDVKILQGEAWN
ncbi:unnamed protein product, partial [Mesorhabditis belari]|uniref:MARVEL domain-containing protein n=1 Tax=Mesorhabditis belari TaxID=2138241 RepID=A0AAF3EU90_9BILA